MTPSLKPAPVALWSLLYLGCATEPASESVVDKQPLAAAALEAFPGATEPSSICSVDSGAFSANVTNAYFPLRVCNRRVLAGLEDGAEVAVRITVLDEIKLVAGVQTRVVEEYHTVDGELVELSYNYFAQAKGGGTPSGATSPRDGTVCYYGEQVDIYRDDGTVTHDGQWLTGEAGAQPGIVMPAKVNVAQAYLQEVAIGVAQDRAWHTDLGQTLVAVTEDTPLEPGHFSHKVYSKGRGLVRDGETTMISNVTLDRDDCVRAGEEGDDDDGRPAAPLQ